MPRTVSLMTYFGRKPPLQAGTITLKFGFVLKIMELLKAGPEPR